MKREGTGEEICRTKVKLLPMPLHCVKHCRINSRSLLNRLAFVGTGKNYEYVLHLSQNHDEVKDTDYKKSLTKN